MTCIRQKDKPKGYHFKECGLDYVYLVNGYTIEDDSDYGECITIHNAEKLHKEIAKAVLLYKPHLEAQEVRFFRSLLRLTQEQLASKLGVDRRQIIRWESGETTVTESIDGFLRIIVWEYYLDAKKAVAFFEEHKKDRAHYKSFRLKESRKAWETQLELVA